jgi:hypothetical protein
MRVLDKESVERRRRRRLIRRVYQNKACSFIPKVPVVYYGCIVCKKGPNFVWHLDGYDKLKPYGFAIHGCIDG